MTRKKPLVLVLAGNGTTPSSKIIRTGIRDLLDSGKVEEIAIAWHGKDSELNAAFDVLEEHDIPMFIYSEGKVPREYGSLAEDVLISDDYLSDILIDSANRAEELSAECRLALLWDDNNEDLMSRMVLTATSKSITVLDLGNGLVPILVEDDEPTIQSDEAQPLVEEDDEVSETAVEPPAPFSREELAAMPFAALKRMATAQGKMIPAKPTKMNVIDVLLSDGDISTDEVEEMLEQSEPAKKDVVNDRNIIASPIVVVIYDNGATTTVTLTDKQREILNGILRY